MKIKAAGQELDGVIHGWPGERGDMKGEKMKTTDWYKKHSLQVIFWIWLRGFIMGVGMGLFF